ncbi:MAG TPA: CHASE domain-containing protein [Vicinamibacterales bacterium]|nr:CHASE domain-containing protein [Vicinamibacterales bacterium]
MHQLRSWLPWAVLLVTALFTVIGTTYVSHVAQTQDRQRFQAAVQDLTTELHQRIDSAITLLRAGRAFFGSRETVTRREFQELVEHLELEARFPGVQGIGFTRRIPAGGVGTLEDELRRQGAPDFRVWPLADGVDERHVVVLFEPTTDGNRAAIGFDAFSDPPRRAAMQQAWDTGEAVASGRVSLLQEPAGSREPGFVVYLPVYRGGRRPATVSERRDALVGFVYCPFRAQDLLDSLLHGQLRQSIVLRVYDGPVPRADSLLFESTAEGDDVSRTLTLTQSLQVAGREWTLFAGARPAFVGASSRLVPVIFGLGIGIAVLLFLLTRAEAQAGAEAQRIARDLQRSEEELKVASRAKDEFLATLSHELRTPLNAILGWTRMLRLGHLDEEKRTTALEVIERNARAQVQLIEDLLDVSRIITGKLRLEMRTVAVNPIIEEAINTVRPSVEAKGVKLVWRTDPDVGLILAAPDRLQQIIWNLLSNAIKFTPSGGLVELRASRSGDVVRLVVRDTGVGINPAFLPHVFERFRQADSTTTRSHSGVGLGLAIVRHLVELHGGTISASSEGEGKGATFTVTFPSRKAPGGTEPAGEPLAPDAVQLGRPLEGLRVLVVDDEEDSRELTAHALAAHGARVETAGSVRQAIDLLQQRTIDVVVTDLAMPNQDGFSLMQNLRALGSPRLRFVPVIAVTAYARPEDRERVMAEGFQGFLPKPVEFDRLAVMVAHLAGRTA